MKLRMKLRVIAGLLRASTAVGVVILALLRFQARHLTDEERRRIGQEEDRLVEEEYRQLLAGAGPTTPA